MAGKSAAVFDPAKPYSPLSVPAAQTALLLMDYQNLITSFLGDREPQVLQAACKIRDWAIGKEMPIFHCVVDTNGKPNPHSKLTERWSGYEEKLSRMPRLGDISEHLAPPTESRSEKVVTRTLGVISVLKSHGLMEELKSKHIRSLIMCGLSTSNCVFSSVRAASDEGFIVTVVEDACADPVPELHELLMKHTLPSTAHVANAEEIQRVWKTPR